MLVGDEYIFLEEYINTSTKILCRHITCNHEWRTTPDNFLRGRRCPVCSNKVKGDKIAKTNTEFITEIQELVGNEYSFMENYIDSKTKIKCRHNICNHEWNVSPNGFLRGMRCPRCSKNPNYNRDTKQYIEEVYALTGNEYIVLGEYKGVHSKIKMKHNKCDYEWYIAPVNFLSGKNRCPQCNESKGERRVNKYLTTTTMEFQKEYTFDDLLGMGGQPLRFDFAMFDDSNNLKLLIEYDGCFHFRKVYENDSFEIMQIHDERKNQYCKDNNIPLLRIPYWEFDSIEDILFKTLSKLEVKSA